MRTMAARKCGRTTKCGQDGGKEVVWTANVGTIADRCGHLSLIARGRPRGFGCDLPASPHLSVDPYPYIPTAHITYPQV